MKRQAYPYGRYLIKNNNIEILGHEIKDFLDKLGFTIIKFDEKNEGMGVLIIGVNKKVTDYLKQKKPPGHIQEFFYELFSLFSMDFVPLRDIDEKSQRIGIEIYLWPSKNGVLMEMFILPYMQHFDRAEIFKVTESENEQLTDWYLCEHTWENIEPEIVQKFNAKPVIRRA